MTLTPEQKAEGWRWYEGGEPPVKDDETWIEWATKLPFGGMKIRNGDFHWSGGIKSFFYRIIEAQGADAEPARPTPFPADYSELVFDDAGWSQTIIVDGKRPEWLRDDDVTTALPFGGKNGRWTAEDRTWSLSIAIRVRRREPKRETQRACLRYQTDRPFDTDLYVTIDLIDGQPDLSTLKIAEDAL